MKFKIINPSDPYTMTAPDMEVASVAACFLGDGKYGLAGIEEDRGNDVPVFLLGGHDEWFTSKFGMDFSATAEHVLNHRNEELAKAFDSVTLERGKQSSMNDIGARAKSLAAAVRRKVKDQS